MRLAIVIPTLNEASSLEDCVVRARGLADEIVISDGGSQDGTVQRAHELGVTVVSGKWGRGGQLNRGARSTQAEVLLFLHADTRLPKNAPVLIRRAVESGAVGGGFRMGYGPGHPARRLAERLVNLRTRLTGCPLGDQAQFATRFAFESLDGFRPWPILEDLDFIRRLRRLGETAVLDAAVVTSARRICEQGLIKATTVNWLIWLLYFAGFPPDRLAKLYHQIR